MVPHSLLLPSATRSDKLLGVGQEKRWPHEHARLVFKASVHFVKQIKRDGGVGGLAAGIPTASFSQRLP